MKKLLTAAVLSVAFSLHTAQADTGWFTGGSYLFTFDSETSTDTFYDMDQAFQSENFNGAFLGSYQQDTQLFLNSELNVTSNEGNVFDALGIWWRIGTSGSFTFQASPIPLTDEGDIGGGFNRYQGFSAGVDLIDAVGGVEGTYTVQVLAERSHSWEGGSYTSFMGYDGTGAVITEGVDPVAFPSSNYFTATFEVVPEPSTYALLSLAAAGLGAHVIRRRRRASK